MKRLLEQSESPAAKIVVCNRRGPAKQQPKRAREHRLRNNLVDFTRWTREHGWSLPESAALLNLSPRTLRQWRLDAAQPVQPLGRPTLRSSCGDRNDVLALIDELGPRVGVPTLQTCCPHMSRAELSDLLTGYRRVWRARHKQLLHVLQWLVPGAVWAMDYAEAPRPIDGLYPYLLGVRDLASGQQLLWLPLKSATAAETIPALLPLFLVHGAPLVLKTDNGSPFIADDVLKFLLEWGVEQLFSPPRMPRYNGGMEAGIGSAKTRTEQEATRHGRPGEWSWDDTEASRAQANAEARPHGETGPTPDEAWTARRPIRVAERTLFRTTVAAHRQELRAQGGWSDEVLPQEARAIDRRAIPRALVEHGFLLYRRRRIPLPFPTRKAANIT